VSSTAVVSGLQDADRARISVIFDSYGSCFLGTALASVNASHCEAMESAALIFCQVKEEVDRAVVEYKYETEIGRKA